MNIRLFFAWGHISWDVVWFRCWPNGCGVSFTRTPMLFSERTGHTKVRQLGFGWRIVLLKGGAW